MSGITKDTGVGRATLYKYFPDVESILRAWHDREIDRHLDRLLQVRDGTEGAMRRLETVLTAYAAAISHPGRHDSEIAAELDRGDHVAAAHQRLRDFIRDLVADAAEAGAVRRDVPADELAVYCLHALAAAARLQDAAAVRRLVRTTLSGLQPGQ
ncbi:TetR/AcrR family transcriptional regulator [Actinoallomurus soli]|uniref:TetR/AcrR family transcriptional regulator n=1 Tax=Actinoallomurus soli TaxID=2952535 RepID=UPI002092505F|nr:TetR/AcrR family transcriptional regulator [Actinoallomurus soli]MCO5972395.1 TetR/AcrR family transcriptional regulator [Actinoallomurus soli]